jgi:proline iminopeptidase
LARKPQDPKRDPLEEEIDALLKELPEADPFLKGDPEELAAEHAAVADSTKLGVNGTPKTPSEPTRRDRIFVWIRVGLGAVAGIAVTQWPYVGRCGFSLLGFLAALLVIVVAGVWASIWAWKMRMAIAHLLALAVTAWGVALLSSQVLPRVGYAAAGAEWRCPDPIPDSVLRERGGLLRRPGGTLLHYRSIGSGPVGLIAAGAMELTDLLRPMAEQQSVVLYDPRHRGASRATNDTAGVGIDGEVDDLAAVRQHFAAEGIAVLGWSYTAATVAKFAALRPDIVNRVVLVGPIPPRRASYQLDWTRGAGQDSLGLELLRIMRERGEDEENSDDFCRRYWEIAVLRPWMGDSAALARSNLDPCRFENERPERREASLARLLDAFGDWDWTADVSNFAGPVLVIHGTADPVTIEGAEEWIQSFPNARLLSIEGAGHMPWLEQPDVVLGAIETFLGGSWPVGAVGRPEPEAT